VVEDAGAQHRLDLVRVLLAEDDTRALDCVVEHLQHGAPAAVADRLVLDVELQNLRLRELLVDLDVEAVETLREEVIEVLDLLVYMRRLAITALMGAILMVLSSCSARWLVMAGVK